MKCKNCGFFSVIFNEILTTQIPAFSPLTLQFSTHIIVQMRPSVKNLLVIHSTVEFKKVELTSCIYQFLDASTAKQKLIRII